MIKNIIIIGLLILIGFGIYGKYLMWNVESETKIETKTVIKTIKITDTVTIKEPQIVYREKYTPVLLPIAPSSIQSSQRDSIEVILPYHIYSDTIKKDSSSFAYNIEVEGFLRDFNYNFDVHTRYTTKTITKTNTKHRFVDIYAIGGFSQGPYIGLDLAVKKYKIGYRLGYDQKPIHHLELGYRFFDF